MRQLIAMLLLLCVPALAQDKSYSVFPTGEGDPDAVTCRPPLRIPGERLPGPEVCKKNSVWAQYRRDKMDVAPDGKHDITLKAGDVGPGRNCHQAGGGEQVPPAARQLHDLSWFAATGEKR